MTYFQSKRPKKAYFAIFSKKHEIFGQTPRSAKELTAVEKIDRGLVDQPKDVLIFYKQKAYQVLGSTEPSSGIKIQKVTFWPKNTVLRGHFSNFFRTTPQVKYFFNRISNTEISSKLRGGVVQQILKIFHFSQFLGHVENRDLAIFDQKSVFCQMVPLSVLQC